jgi:WD40 repeat protein
MKHRNSLAILLVALLVLAAGVGIYYQIFYHSREVNAGLATPERTFRAHTAEVWTVKFSPDGRFVASGGVDSSVTIWEPRTGKIIRVLKHPLGVTYLTISPNGKYIATGSYDAKVRIWDVKTGAVVKELEGHKGTVWHVHFSPNGKLLASSGEDASVKIWEVAGGRLLFTLKGHKLTVWSVKFSADGNRIASGSFDGTIKLWDTKNGWLLTTLDKHTEAVVDLAFNHNGQILASVSDDKTIRLWEAEDGRLIRSMEVPEHVQAVAFSPDDRLLLTGGRDKPLIGELLQNFLGDSKMNKGVSARLWNVETGRLLQTFTSHGNDVNDVAFSPDGCWLATASSDKTVQLWKVLQ